MRGDQIRSFVSIDLEDNQILSQVESLLSSLTALGGDFKPVERENIHLTFKFLGNITPAKLAEVKSALSQVKFEPFQLEIRGTGAFPNLKRMNVVWVGIGEGWTEAQAIFEQTERLLHEVGFSRETRPFSPHITIARVRSGRKRDEIAAFLGHLADRSFGAIAVERLKLKQSVLSPSGPKYSTLFEVAAEK
ncbi:RNA 2',3'-cyclic phosphodiesterase [Candidatus Bathyarchaeota archaeon]|nr:RNA 2',3'-cyclic phosphodiesterase [Candidatus Bathyarchaeota archaeon]